MAPLVARQVLADIDPNGSSRRIELIPHEGLGAAPPVANLVAPTGIRVLIRLGHRRRGGGICLRVIGFRSDPQGDGGRTRDVQARATGAGDVVPAAAGDAQAVELQGGPLDAGDPRRMVHNRPVIALAGGVGGLGAAAFIQFPVPDEVAQGGARRAQDQKTHNRYTSLLPILFLPSQMFEERCCGHRLNGVWPRDSRQERSWRVRIGKGSDFVVQVRCCGCMPDMITPLPVEPAERVGPLSQPRPVPMLANIFRMPNRYGLYQIPGRTSRRISGRVPHLLRKLPCRHGAGIIAVSLDGSRG